MVKMINVNTHCPKCHGGMLTIVWYPGDPGVWRTSNGDGEPPTPAQIEEIRASCECWPDALIEAIFEPQTHEEWLCNQHASVSAYNNLNPLGAPCKVCGRLEPVGARHYTVGNASHPLLLLLESLARAYLEITEWFINDQLDAYIGKTVTIDGVEGVISRYDPIRTARATTSYMGSHPKARAQLEDDIARASANYMDALEMEED